MDDDAEDRGFGLFRGGLLRRIGRALRLVRDEPRDVVRQSLALALVAWVPLVVLGAIERLAIGQWDPLLSQLEVHVRWLVAVPLLFAAERLVDERIAVLRRYLCDSGIVPADRVPDMHRIERGIASLSDSVVFELALLAIALATSVGRLDAVETPAGWWDCLVSVPLTRFLLFRWLQRWLLWSALLLAVSRLELDLFGLHPDRAGGLGMLVYPARAFSVVILSTGTVVAANLAMRMRAGVEIGDLVPVVGVYVGLAVLLELLPFLPFAPMLIRCKHEAMHRYGVFGQLHVRAFADRWLQRPSGQSLGSADIQSLNDLGGSYSVIREMRIVPFPNKFVGETVVIALAPILPLYLQTVSVATIAAYLVKAIF